MRSIKSLRRFIPSLIVLAAFATGSMPGSAQQESFSPRHGAGAPTLQIPAPGCGTNRLYIDDLTGTEWLGSRGAGYPCAWVAQPTFATVVFPWSDTFLGCCNAVTGGHEFTPPSATITRMQISASTLLTGCTTNPVLEVKDGTTGAALVQITLTTGAASWDSGVVSVAATAGDPLQLQMVTAGVGCNSATLYVTLQYHN